MISADLNAPPAAPPAGAVIEFIGSNLRSKYRVAKGGGTMDNVIIILTLILCLLLTVKQEHIKK